MKFKIGDKVYYVSGKHGAYRENPLKGSEFECMGIIENSGHTNGIHCDISVKWKNGSINSYRSSDLQLAQKPGHPLTKIFK